MRPVSTRRGDTDAPSHTRPEQAVNWLGCPLTTQDDGGGAGWQQEGERSEGKERVQEWWEGRWETESRGGLGAEE